MPLRKTLQQDLYDATELSIINNPPFQRNNETEIYDAFVEAFQQVTQPDAIAEEETSFNEENNPVRMYYISNYSNCACTCIICS